MTRVLIYATALCLLLGAQSADAQFSSTVTAASDYDFRGVTLSGKDPALQASLDYAFSGFAVGAWASNVDFADDAEYELDVYANYTGTINDTFSWTVGIVRYMWPDSVVVGDYNEAFVGLNVGAFSAKQWYADDYGGLDVGAWYTEGNFTLPITEKVSVSFHAGYNYGDYWDDFGGGDLVDYSVGLGYVAGHFNLGAKFTGTDASGTQKVTGDIFNNEPRFLVSIATTFPWGE